MKTVIADDLMEGGMSTGEMLFYGLLVVVAIWIIYNSINSVRSSQDKKGSSPSITDYPGSNRSGSTTSQSSDDDNIVLPPIETNVAGVTFEGRQTVVESLRIGEYLEIIQEPDNPYDPNAVKVMRSNGKQVGYVPREVAKDIKWIFDAGFAPHRAEVIKKVGRKRKGQ